LIPADQSANKVSGEKICDWTDVLGRYHFDRIQPGEYILAVMKHVAPDGRHPFAGLYYPDTQDEARASRLLVTREVPVELPSIRLPRIETVTLRVRVTFEDGGIPDWSNLLFHNPSFPDQGVIGNEAPGVEHGQGEITLPKGFEYYARAAVDCDSGLKIETRESMPVQQLKIKDGYIPRELLFTIPGPACKLWYPK